MIQKGSYLMCSDKNGVLLVGVFHLYRGFFVKWILYGFFLKISVKKTISSLLVLKKMKILAFLVLTRFRQTKKDGSWLMFKLNSCVLLKRRLVVLGKNVWGPINFNVFRKRFLLNFIKII
jgi:ribosomal protein L14